jgi:diketogulonate reductase-like aldo/keto reductase
LPKKRLGIFQVNYPVSNSQRLPQRTRFTETNFSQLNTGAKIPAVGLGTWQSQPGQVREAVKAALQGGYRHIDTALAYGNEKEVGQGIKDSGVPREEIWVTTKLDNPWHKRVEEGINTSLKDLGLDYVDLYLMVSLHHTDMMSVELSADRTQALALFHRPR